MTVFLAVLFAAQARAAAGPPSFAVAANRGMQELLGSGDHSPVGWSYKTGLWGGQTPANWWQSALAVTTLVRYAERTGSRDPRYHSVLERVYARNLHSKSRPQFTNQFMDDTAWWGLAWLAASQYELDYRGDRVDARRFLNLAEHDASYIAAQPRPCGGIEWGAGFPPDLISNVEFVALTAQLSRLRGTPGPLYGPARASAWLAQGQAVLSWVEGSGMVNLQTGAVYDGLNQQCKVIGGAITYTQGETAEALLQMGITVGNPAYADQAEAFLSYATTPASGLVGASGILQERCEATPGKCAQQRFRLDLPAFKGVLIDAMSDWATATRRHNFDAFLGAQATAVVNNAVRGPGNYPAHCAKPRTCQFAFHWAGAPDPAPLGLTLGGQESALDALTAVLPGRR